MKMTERMVDGVTILDLDGKLTPSDGDTRLKDKIHSLIHQGRKDILLNLEDVPYVDSSGLGDLVALFATVSCAGGSLKLLNLTNRIQNLLAITKLVTVFECFTSETEGVESFSAAAAAR